MPSPPTPPPTTEALDALLSRWRDGDTAARDALLDFAQERVRVVARRQLNVRFLDLRADAGLQTDEVQQEANVKIVRWVRGELTRVPESLRAYFAAVRTIVRRTLLDFARQLNAAGRPTRALTDADDPPHHPPEADDRGERLRVLVAELPDDQREAVELRYWGGRTLEEIALLMGLRDATDASRLILRAQKALGGKFNPDNFT